MARLHTFSAGYCTHPACMALKGAGLASRCFPSQAWLIETRAGPVLWDTGYAERFRDATAQGVFRLYPLITPVHIGPEDGLAHQLRHWGLNAHDIPWLVLSHFHADHMAGLIDFPRARVFVSGSGWNAVRHLRGLAAVRQAFVPGLLPADVEARLAFVEALPRVALPALLQPFEHGWDLTGTGEVLLVELPGHAVGHLGAFVQEEHGWSLLASDAAWDMASIHSLHGPSELSFLIQHSRSAYYRTLRQLHALHTQANEGAAPHNRPPRVKIRLSHVTDPVPHTAGSP